MFALMQAVGTADVLDFVFVTMLGDHFSTHVTQSPHGVLLTKHEREWEFPQWSAIERFTAHTTGRVNVLYLHTKGALGKSNSTAWREYLLYFVITQHKQCLHYLRECEQDCVGVNMHRYPWTVTMRSDAISLATSVVAYRLLCEDWLHSFARVTGTRPRAPPAARMRAASGESCRCKL